MSKHTFIMPDHHQRRSLAWRAWADDKTKDNSMIARSKGVVLQRAGQDDASMTGRCGLIDLTVLERCGFRGQQAAAHLLALNLPVPAQANQAAVSDHGETVLRLSAREFWVLSAAEDDTQRLHALSQQPLPTQDCYSLYCQHSHAWLMLTGDHRAAVMAKLCAVDMRSEAFAIGCIAQTSAARSNVIVVHHPWGQHTVFSLLCDITSAEYLYGALLDAMKEFDGGPVGLESLV